MSTSTSASRYVCWGSRRRHWNKFTYFTYFFQSIICHLLSTIFSIYLILSAYYLPTIPNTFGSPHLDQRLATRPKLDRITENPTSSAKKDSVCFTNKPQIFFVFICPCLFWNNQSCWLEKLGHLVLHVVLLLVFIVELLISKVDAEETWSAVPVCWQDVKGAQLSKYYKQTQKHRIKRTAHALTKMGSTATCTVEPRL